MIPRKVKWFGVVPMSKASKNNKAKRICLVLPSRFDGWELVVTSL